MRDFSHIPPWSPRPEFHDEQDPTIDRALQSAAQAQRMGMSEQDTLAHLLARGFSMGDAVNIVRGSTILVEHDH